MKALPAFPSVWKPPVSGVWNLEHPLPVFIVQRRSKEASRYDVALLARPKGISLQPNFPYFSLIYFPYFFATTQRQKRGIFSSLSRRIVIMSFSITPVWQLPSAPAPPPAPPPRTPSLPRSRKGRFSCCSFHPVWLPLPTPFPTLLASAALQFIQLTTYQPLRVKNLFTFNFPLIISNPLHSRRYCEALCFRVSGDYFGIRRCFSLRWKSGYVHELCTAK